LVYNCVWRHSFVFYVYLFINNIYIIQQLGLFLYTRHNLFYTIAESIRLKYFGDLRNKEIATVLGISEKTVASNLTRALDKIRQSNFLQ